MMEKIDKIFDSFVGYSLFKNKVILQSNFTPETVPHREKEIEDVASILAPTLRGERVSNLFIYGNTGTGKTLSVQYVCNRILKKSRDLGKGKLRVVNINCKMKKVSDTEYRIVAELIKELGGSVPATGLPTDEVYSRFVDLIDKDKQLVLIILDEIDEAVNKISDRFLYTLTRLNSDLKNAQINLIGISNSLTFMENLDPRVRSSLAEEEIIFSPYNALQLKDILKERAKDAFQDGVLGDGVIEKCAAFAAREHGDARRALDLLRVAGEIAERGNNKKINLSDIDTANEKIEKDKILAVVESQPKQHQLVLSAIIFLDGKIDNIFTGDVFNKYQEVCEKTKNEILTQRRVGDILAEFDMLGIINARVISKGRQGRTREIKLMLSSAMKDKTIEILGRSLEI